MGQDQVFNWLRFFFYNVPEVLIYQFIAEIRDNFLRIVLFLGVTEVERDEQFRTFLGTKYNGNPVGEFIGGLLYRKNRINARIEREGVIRSRA